MLNRYLQAMIPVAGVVFCLAGAFVLSGSDEPNLSANEPPTAGEKTFPAESYIGTDRCITCHRKQAGSWSETKHAQAFENLPTKYRDDTSCLKCHLTGFGEPGGYAPGMTAEEAQPFQSIGCEACHGAGAAHDEAVKRWTLADPGEEESLLKEIKKTIVRTPTDSQCATCHTAQGHQTHPPYEGQPLSSGDGVHPDIRSGQLSKSLIGSTGEKTAASASLSSSPDLYSVKTCGSCHYEQFKQWRVETHAELSAGLPAQYGNDDNCLTCHRKHGNSSDWYATADDPQANVKSLGVGCESCHGSALKHVLYNKQHVSDLRLEPEILKAASESIRSEKPASACLQCHIREGHKAHTEYEKPNVEKTK